MATLCVYVKCKHTIPISVLKFHPRLKARPGLYDTATVSSQLSATNGTWQMLAGNPEWRIIERGGESTASGLLESVPMVLVADSERGV